MFLTCLHFLGQMLSWVVTSSQLQNRVVEGLFHTSNGNCACEWASHNPRPILQSKRRREEAVLSNICKHLHHPPFHMHVLVILILKQFAEDVTVKYSVISASDFPSWDCLLMESLISDVIQWTGSFVIKELALVLIKLWWMLDNSRLEIILIISVSHFGEQEWQCCLALLHISSHSSSLYKQHSFIMLPGNCEIW